MARYFWRLGENSKGTAHVRESLALRPSLLQLESNRCPPTIPSVFTEHLLYVRYWEYRLEKKVGKAIAVVSFSI